MVYSEICYIALGCLNRKMGFFLFYTIYLSALCLKTKINYQYIDALEKVQRRATKVPHELKRFDYHTRLSLVGLTRLDKRRERGDCIQAFKLAKKLKSVDWHAPLETRAPKWDHRERNRPERDRNCMQRSHFFSDRVANKWNALPDFIIAADTGNQFKNRYDAVARG